MMKKVLMEEISLRDLLKKMDELLSKDLNDDKYLSPEKNSLNAAKILAAFLFQEALFKFGQDLKHEQQLSESLANIFTHIYTSESIISRAQQGDGTTMLSKMSYTIAKIDTTESMLDIQTLSIKCLNRIFSESIPSDILNKFQKIQDSMKLNNDTISLKKVLGEHLFHQES